MEAMLYNLYSDRALFSGDEAKQYALKYAQMAADGQLHDISAAAAYDKDIENKLQWLAQHVTEEKPLCTPASTAFR